MKKFIYALSMLFGLVAMLAFSFCVFFHYNTLGFATIGDAIGSAFLLPIAMVVFFAAAVLSLICWLASVSSIQGKKTYAIIQILILLVEAGYVGYIFLSIAA